MVCREGLLAAGYGAIFTYSSPSAPLRVCIPHCSWTSNAPSLSEKSRKGRLIFAAFVLPFDESFTRAVRTVRLGSAWRLHGFASGSWVSFCQSLLGDGSPAQAGAGRFLS